MRPYPSNGSLASLPRDVRRSPGQGVNLSAEISQVGVFHSGQRQLVKSSLSWQDLSWSNIGSRMEISTMGQ